MKTEIILSIDVATDVGIDVVIVDTGCANLNSVRYAFERLGARVLVTDNAAQIAVAPRVVLPGVGTARAAMTALAQKGLIDTLCKLTQPLLGICLGMQLLCTLSKERGGAGADCECLGLIPAEIDALGDFGLPLPHMGWNQISPGLHPLFAGIAPGSHVYFVHGYRAAPGDFTLAQCRYGEDFSTAIGKDNFMGVQFHPEKSAALGARILANFLAMKTNKSGEKSR
jgi:imidazole glycerol-phosphate synthase subunit HisH